MKDLDTRGGGVNNDFKEEYIRMLEWIISEEEKVIEQLKKEGKYNRLDGHYKELDYIRAERAKRTRELFDKYDLPNKPKQ